MATQQALSKARIGISIERDLLERVRAAAKDIGITISEFFSLACREYLERMDRTNGLAKSGETTISHG